MTRLRVDMTRCDAYGYCAELLPESITVDQWGYPVLPRDGVDVSNASDAAEAAVRACPRKALFLQAGGSDDERRIRVMLVHGKGDSGIPAILASARDLRVVGHASDSDAAMSVAGRTRPDVVLMDLATLGPDGFEVTRRLSSGGSRVVMLNSSAEPETVDAAIDVGAVGYLQTNSEPAEIVAAVRSAAHGETPFSPLAAKALLIARATPAPDVAARPRTRRQSKPAPVWTRVGGAFAAGAAAAAVLLWLATGSASPTVWSAHVVSRLTGVAASTATPSALPTAAPQAPPVATPAAGDDSGHGRHGGGEPGH